jgi:hypothetical protein
VLLILSVMALIAAVHALQVESYGPGAVERIGLGALTILPSILGLALLLVLFLGPLLGVAWALVGYAVSRTAGRRTERPSNAARFGIPYCTKVAYAEETRRT